MKKSLLALSVVLVFMGYVVYQKSTGKSSTDVNGNGTSAQVESTNPNPSSSPTPTSPSPSTQAKYKDGSYLGDVVDAVFGLMQVKAVIVAGKLADVQYVKYPYDKPTTIQIQDAAMPLWKANALRIQAANVDIVSGATQSSEGFQKTLASALVKAEI